MEKYRVLGIMSGTSLDGLDIALCEFKFIIGVWNYRICKAETIPYPNEWLLKLSTAHKLTAWDFIHLHKQYGSYIGQCINYFIDHENKAETIIASHGHTIFHKPGEGVTFQIGDGACITAKTNMITISDFRSLDVALGGQGAPLVPIGDEILFSDYDFCLNLGGFANVSLKNAGVRRAFDICPVNIVLNKLASEKGLLYDKDGKLGEQGNIYTPLLKELNSLEFYKVSGPKSLGREWLESEFLPIIYKYDISLEDKLRTLYEHISYQIAQSLLPFSKGIVLTTGGGAWNSYLIKILRDKTKHEIVIPDKLTVEFKEALIFAFLGVLRLRNECNSLSIVTGASRDNCGGCIFVP